MMDDAKQDYWAKSKKIDGVLANCLSRLLSSGNRVPISNKVLVAIQYMRMKKSDEITSPASFLKKQSHIITNNVASPDYYHFTPTTRHQLDKEMHRSHFHSEANSTKLMEDTYFDQPDAMDMYSQGKGKPNDDQNASHKNDLLGDKSNHNFESFYQSDELSSEHENSQTKSQKKFGLSNYNFSEKVIKRVSSNDGTAPVQFLYIDSRKQKLNNKYLTLSDVQALQQEIKKYQISIDKLKQEHQRLRSQKFKLSNDSMQLVELRLEHQGLKRKIKQLQTQKQMHLTIDAHQQQTSKMQPTAYHPATLTPNNSNQYGQSFMTTSCLENNSKRSDKEDLGKRNIPTFRNNQGKQQIEGKSMKQINSPRACVPEPESKPQNYKILQNMKSPYFLKKN